MSLIRYTPRGRAGLLMPLDHLLAALDVAAAWTLVVLVAVMVAVVSAQVGLRYLLNNSLGWADEVSRLCFVWTMFLAIPLGLKSGAHIGVDMLTARLPEGLRDGLARVVALLGAGLMALVAWESGRMAHEQWDELMATLNASAAWFIVPLALCGVHGALHLLWLVLTGPSAEAPTVLEELG